MQMDWRDLTAWIKGYLHDVLVPYNSWTDKENNLAETLAGLQNLANFASFSSEALAAPWNRYGHIQSCTLNLVLTDHEAIAFENIPKPHLEDWKPPLLSREFIDNNKNVCHVAKSLTAALELSQMFWLLWILRLYSTIIATFTFMFAFSENIINNI